MARVEINQDGLEALKQHVIRRASTVPDAIVRDQAAMSPVDTGEFSRSGRVEKIGESSWRITWAPRGTDGRSYAVYPEMGTRHMQAQPSIRPAVYQKREF